MREPVCYLWRLLSSTLSSCHRHSQALESDFTSQLEPKLRSFSPMTAARPPGAVWPGALHSPQHSQSTPGKHASQRVLLCLKPSTGSHLLQAESRTLDLPGSGPAHLSSLNLGHFLQVSHWVFDLHTRSIPKPLLRAPRFASRPRSSATGSWGDFS